MLVVFRDGIPMGPFRRVRDLEANSSACGIYHHAFITRTIVDKDEWDGKSAIHESPETESKWLLASSIPNTTD